MAVNTDDILSGGDEESAGGGPDPQDPAVRYLNRELSELDFNAPLLDLAESPDVPLLERVKFLAIFSERLDEVFQVRVAGLKEQVDAGLVAQSPDGRSAAEQLRAIRPKLEHMVARESSLFLGEIVPALDEAGLHLSSWNALNDDDRKHLDEVFERLVF